MLDGDCANPRGAEDATRAIVMVDPFPGADTDVGEFKARDDLIGTFLSLFTAMKNQARFKPDDLALAQEADVYSRFLIAPTRGNERYPIACGALGGFSGFLSEDFRRHDFMLGRRNCQAFLRKHFVLSAKHPLFNDWGDEQRKPFKFDEDGKTFLPIIPLLDAAATECAAPVWPRYTGSQLDTLGDQISERYDKLMGRFVHQFTKDNWWARQALKLFANRKRRDAVNWVCRRVEGEFRVFGLM
jgi:tryptophan 2,3-dioxygenase